MAPGREWPSMILKEAQQIAHGLIQGFISPDQSDGTCPSFCGALLQALQAAHERGEAEKLTHQ